MFYTAKRSPRTSNYVESGTNGCCSNPVKKRGVFDNSVKVSTIQRKGVRIVFAPDPTSWKKLPAMRLRLDHLNPTIRPSSPSLPSTNLVSTFMVPTMSAMSTATLQSVSQTALAPPCPI
ncbi:hypothetical protein PABG_12406 [Paracoccidioides brasiliensis Pb03]|nr:hypothetical protein PABG_12406 [Paracoccidioides brasiliensis Pb03]